MNCNLFAVSNKPKKLYLVLLRREKISLINMYSRMRITKLQNSFPTLKKK